MTQSLGDLLVVSNLDNTLLAANGDIPQVNRDVIALFCERGGRFTVATNRSVESVRMSLSGLELSMPAVCCGGSVLYDFAAQQRLKQHTLDHAQTLEVLQNMLQRFPKIGVEIQTGNGEIRIIRANEWVQAQLDEERISGVLETIDAVPEDWVKVVFAALPEEIDAVERYGGELRVGKDIDFVRANPAYCEIMPKGISKASGLAALSEQCGVPMENIIMIGDYYNDLNAMKAAGYAVAVADAPNPVKVAADAVTLTDAADGAVGEFLYALVKQYEKNR